ncbi:MAG: hypothetical protein NC123_15405 [Butyrivibrio sp.]|nr:hypothetical protein [Acetatifactor muris]MCM1560907.1 hypothetical protein [Butyrivibrio sp.]
MKTGKITAKLRDAVPVCLMVEGKEVKRYKNIELPDMLKEVEMADFHFNVPEDGKITFEIHYAPGVLPEVFPEPRAKVTRAEKAAAKAKAAAEQEAPAEAPAEEETALAAIPETPAESQAGQAEETAPASEPETDTGEAAEEASTPTEDSEAGANGEPSTMEISYNVTGPRRKELATAVGNFIGAAPVYQKAPTYAFAIGSYTIDRNGKLSGEKNAELTEALTEQGFTAA